MKYIVPYFDEVKLKTHQYLKTINLKDLSSTEQNVVSLFKDQKFDAVLDNRRVVDLVLNRIRIKDL